MKVENDKILIEILQDLALIRRKIRLPGVLTKKGDYSIIHPAQREFLSLLADNGEKNVNKLAKFLDVSAGAITQLAEPLENSGLIMREIDTKDRRKINIKLTAKGRSQLKTFRKRALEKLSNLLKPLTREELKTLKKINHKIAVNAIKK